MFKLQVKIFFLFQSDLMRCIPENAECAEVLIGSMRNLARPIMAFVRLSEGQLISKKIWPFLHSITFFCFVQSRWYD
jgi:hypothetical protein